MTNLLSLNAIVARAALGYQAKGTRWLQGELRKLAKSVLRIAAEGIANQLEPSIKSDLIHPAAGSIEF